MPHKSPSSVKTFLQGFQYAFNGMRILITERNIKFHLVAAVAIIAASIYFELNRLEWVIILLCIGIVLSVEALNTSIEMLCDYIQPEHDSKIGLIKDVAAAAVLIVAILSVIIGIMIFLPKIV